MGYEFKNKPGAHLAFKPRSTLSSELLPDFSALSLGGKTDNTIGTYNITAFATKIRHTTDTMVTERAPPKAPLQSIDPNEDSTRREKSPESDTDISAIIGMKGWGSIKGSVRDSFQDPSQRQSGPSSSIHRPTFGHPTKMVSSLKQKADVFIHQKNRPEHHLDGPSRVSGPKPPAYKDRKAPALPVFDSNAAWETAPKPKVQYGEDVFYTDPAKASEDLKALLEGGMESDDEDEEQKKAGGTKNSAIDAKDGSVEGLKIKLLPHQVEGVEWMRGRELGPVKRGRVPKGGILADDMGLGKTLQTVSLILTNQKPQKEDKAWKKNFEGVEKTTLVVAPLALIRQWEHEIKDKVSKKAGLKVLVHHGPQRTKSFKTLALYDVVITTYQILVSEHGASSDAPDGVKAGCFGLHWWRVVLDEAHTVKNRNAKATKACYALRSEYRWCLSGTPMQNNLDELQSLVKFLRIKPYDDLREWKEHIDKPLKNGKGHIAIRRLHSLLRCFMKRRTKDILKEEGALNPGGKPTAKGEVSSTGLKVTERRVLTISTELSPAERKFYDRLEARADRRMEAMMKEKISYANAFTLLLRLRQACNHPKLVEGKLDKDKDALSGQSSQQSSQRSRTGGADIDAMADMFAGMGIETKSCGICGRQLSNDDYKLGGENCGECAEDLAYFNSQESADRKKPKKQGKVKKVVKQKTETALKKNSRRPRNRNAVVDSDDEDEEAEGSWLVPEDERGALKLGKAGGQKDEDAEGGGDWLGDKDSEDDDDAPDNSNLSGFVIDDEAARKEPGYRSVDDASDDEDSLLSISAITKQMASQTLNDKPSLASEASASETDSEDDSESEESELGVDESEIYPSDDDSPRYRGAPQVLASSKIRELLKILNKEAEAHKFIVFSEFTSMLDLVEPFLRKSGIRYTRYDGSMRNDDREESLRRLREEKSTRVLLCSLKCGSLGLNLTAATRVVILEPFWNPFVEEQAIDRVHRLTQTVDVIVYKLTVTATVEERILALQDKKRELAAAALEGGSKKAGLKLGLNEIIDLFRPGGGLSAGNEDHGNGGFERETSAERRSGGGLLGKKAVVRRQESEVYGRRW